MKTIAVYFNATERHQYGRERRNDVELFRDLLTPHMDGFEFIMVDAVHESLPEDPTKFDGVILSGSVAMVGDDEVWIANLLDQIRILDAKKVKMLGVCFGHQAIAKALGGVVEPKDITIGVPHLEILAPQKWMHPYLPSLRLYAGNFQQVTKVPEGMKRIAIGRGNPNAMLIKDDHIVSIQFHPEFNQLFMEGYVDDCYAKHSISAHIHSTAKSEISGGTDSEIMAKWIAHFFKN